MAGRRTYAPGSDGSRPMMPIADSVESEDQDQEIELDEENPDPIHEIIENDDGTATITLGPSAVDEDPEFYENLADGVLSADVLESASSELIELIEKDRDARKKRDEQQEEGLRRTGMGDDAPGGAQFAGSSKVVHPVMAAACIDFSSRAIKEMFPAAGPVKTQIIGKTEEGEMQRADRIAKHMNWQLTRKMPEYRFELEQTFTQLPLGGSQYMKFWWDENERRPRCEFVPIDNVYIPYSAAGFYTASRVTHRQELTEFEFKRRVNSGMYRDIEGLVDGDEPEMTKSEKANQKIEGKKSSGYNEDGTRLVYEIYTYRDWGGEDGLAMESSEEEDGAMSGTACPYIITIDESTGHVLSVYRNWSPDDPLHTKLDWMVEYFFIPWRGAYGVGLPHLIGGLSAAATGALRALLDSAHINNAATLLKLKGARIGGSNTSIDVTQVAEVETPPTIDDIRKVAMPLPFNPPSQVLYQLLGWLTDAATGVVSVAEERLADSTNNGPVGTTQALIEQGSIIFSAIHSRLHYSQGKALDILYRLNKMYMNEEEEIQELGKLIVKQKDYEGPCVVIPVSDPHIFSETQRVAQNQMVLQLAAMAPPGMYNMHAVHRRILEQSKVPNISEILPDQPKPEEEDPVSENVLMSMNRPVMAFPHQDHESHLLVHMHFMNSPLLGQNALIGKIFTPQCLEHLKQHVIFWYAQSVGRLIEQHGNFENFAKVAKEVHPDEIARTEALALPALQTAAEQNQIVSMLPQSIQQAIQFVQTVNRPPEDPNMVLAKAEMTKATAAMKKGELDAQLSSQELQVKAALESQDLAIKQMNAETQRALAELKANSDGSKSDLDTIKMTLDTIFKSHDAKIREVTAQHSQSIEKLQKLLEAADLDHQHSIDKLDLAHNAQMDHISAAQKAKGSEPDVLA